MPGPWACLDLQKRAVRPLRAAVARLVRGAGPAFFLINRFFGLSITTNLSGMARTRAGLSGRPTCRPGAFCPGLSAPQGWPLAAMPAGLPVGTLRPCLTSAVDPHRAASAALRFAIWPQASRSSCLGCWLWLSCCLGAALLPVFAVVVVPPCAACRASKTVMAVGHPFMGRGSRRRWGNPEGVPRSQTARALKIFKVKKCARALRLWITFYSPRQCWIWKSRAWVIERIGRG